MALLCVNDSIKYTTMALLCNAYDKHIENKVKLVLEYRLDVNVSLTLGCQFVIDVCC